MSETAEIVLRKVLTRNDVGDTGSHQMGIHVPKLLAPLMPKLDERIENPDCVIEVETSLGRFSWRYIHYNRKLFAKGTRDEYRLLLVADFLRAAAPSTGDALELVVTGPYSLRAKVRASSIEEPELVLQSAGPWKVVRLSA